MITKTKFITNPTPKLVVTYSTGDIEKHVYYTIPNNFFITNESLAALIIVGRPFSIEHISFDFSINHKMKSIIEREYGIEVRQDSIDQNYPVVYGLGKSSNPMRRTANILSFSGGVDSLAANYLCSDTSTLLSMDFGDRFSREKRFFQSWNPLVVSTNVRDKPFNERVDWRFMASGVILMSDYIGIKNVLFGTILEATMNTFCAIPQKSYEERIDYQAFRLANLRVSLPVLSLSEYGTTLVAMQYGTEILEKSIVSAADPESMKLFRKKLLHKIVSKQQIGESWANAHKPSQLGRFGNSFADSVLALYFIYKLGWDFVNKYIMAVNYEYRNTIEAFDLSFFEKYNQFHLQAVPFETRHILESRIQACQLEPYTSNDIYNLNLVRNFLKEKYNL